MSTQNENECVINGVRYVAAAAELGKCDTCVGWEDDVVCIHLPPCGPYHRRDGRNVVFRAVPDSAETTASAAVTAGEVNP